MPGLIPRRTPGGLWPPGVPGAVTVLTVLAAGLLGSFLLTRDHAPAGVPASGPAAGLAGAGPTGDYASTPLGVMYRSTPVTRRIALAEQHFTSACMARRGQRYQAPAQQAEHKPQQPAPFGLEPVTETRPSPAPPRQPADPAYDRALLGDPAKRVTAQAEGIQVSSPASGCLAAAKDRLHGDRRVRWMQLQVILFEVQKRAVRSAQDDTRLLAANERWRDCVHKRGYSWQSPAEVFGEVPFDADPRTAPAARTDLDCKRKTGYLADAYAALADAQRRELGPEPNALTEWQALLYSQDERATAILDQS